MKYFVYKDIEFKHMDFNNLYNNYFPNEKKINIFSKIIDLACVLKENELILSMQEINNLYYNYIITNKQKKQFITLFVDNISNDKEKVNFLLNVITVSSGSIIKLNEIINKIRELCKNTVLTNFSYYYFNRKIFDELFDNENKIKFVNDFIKTITKKQKNKIINFMKLGIM